MRAPLIAILLLLPVGAQAEKKRAPAKPQSSIFAVVKPGKSAFSVAPTTPPANGQKGRKGAPAPQPVPQRVADDSPTEFYMPPEPVPGQPGMMPNPNAPRGRPPVPATPVSYYPQGAPAAPSPPAAGRPPEPRYIPGYGEVMPESPERPSSPEGQ